MALLCDERQYYGVQRFGETAAPVTMSNPGHWNTVCGYGTGYAGTVPGK